jgi:Cu-Zn family superoxide dismutase
MDPANPSTETKTASPVTGEPEVTMAKNDDAAAKQAAPPAGGAAPAAPAGDPASATHAEANIKMLGNEGAAVGTLTFDQDGGKVTMKGTFTGLKPGKHGFHIPEKGDCGGRDAKNAGTHFNPTKAKHGPPESAKRHLGDFGNIIADKDGNATFEMTTDSITVAAGVDSIANRAVVIHKGEDNGKTQPSGGSGPPIACGVIEVK